MTGAAGEEHDPLFAGRDAGLALPPLPQSDEVIAGVDVGGMRKGLHALALQGGEVIATYASPAPRAIAEWCVTMQARAVGIDAPCRWSITGRSRPAERELRAIGIHAYATPTLAVATAKPFYRWMLNGADLYLALREHYALYEGEERSPRICFETYPQAVACALAARVLRARDKRANRRAVLSHAGIDIRRLTNIDFVDAALCAVAACYVRAGSYRAYGSAEEGLIYVPGRPRDHTPCSLSDTGVLPPRKPSG